MNVIKVGYGCTKNVGNYENEKFYLEAELSEDESPENAIEILKYQSETLFLGRTEEAKLERKLQQLNRDISNAKFTLSQAKKSWDLIEGKYKDALNFLESQGVSTGYFKDNFPSAPYLSSDARSLWFPDEPKDEIPFSYDDDEIETEEETIEGGEDEDEDNEDNLRF